MTTRKRIVLLLAVVLIGAGLLGRHLVIRLRAGVEGIRVSGNIEVTDAEIGFKIAGLMRERLVSEGEPVTRGQVIARLESGDLERQLQLNQAEVRAAGAVLAELLAGPRPEEVAAAEATVQAVQARVDELVAGARPDEVRAAEAAEAGAAAGARLTELGLERVRQLLATQTVPPQEFDRAKADAERAAAQLAQARAQLALVREGPRQEAITLVKAQLAEARQRCELVRKGVRSETIDQAKARVEQARAAAGLAEIRLGYATVFAPMDGLVLSDHVEPGEYVAPGTPVVTLGELAQVWLRAYVNETDLGRVRVGQKVRVSTDTYPGTVYDGALSFLSSEAEFTPRNVQTAKERVRLVYRVKIRIANPALELKPGMPADAVIGVR